MFVFRFQGGTRWIAASDEWQDFNTKYVAKLKEKRIEF